MQVTMFCNKKEKKGMLFEWFDKSRIIPLEGKNHHFNPHDTRGNAFFDAIETSGIINKLVQLNHDENINVENPEIVQATCFQGLDIRVNIYADYDNFHDDEFFALHFDKINIAG